MDMKTFSKIEIWRFLQNYDDVNCMFSVKFKEPIIIFHLKGLAVKLKCVYYEIFLKKQNMHYIIKMK